MAPRTIRAEPWREVWPGSSPALLQALHILTREGALNADSRRKLKQVLHLVQLLRPAVEAVLAAREAPVIADCGAGKSYLGFILYDLILREAGRGSVVGIEARPDLVAAAATIARDAGFARVQFLESPIAEARIDGPVDIVTALHACDTATDDALAFALAHEARFVALVPCCQAEAARQLSESGPHPLRQLWRHPIEARAFGAHVTDVIRGLVLEAAGYKVRVTEFTGFEHTQKNLLILAERHQRSNPAARAELDRLLQQVPVRPKALAALGG